MVSFIQRFLCVCLLDPYESPLSLSSLALSSLSLSSLSPSLSSLSSSSSNMAGNKLKKGRRYIIRTRSSQGGVEDVEGKIAVELIAEEEEEEGEEEAL